MNRRVVVSLFIVLFFAGTSAAAGGDPGADLGKSFSAIKRHIVTRPKKAAEELADAMARLEELKAANPDDGRIPAFEAQAEKLNEKLEKRLGHRVKPVGSSGAAPLPPVPVPAPVKAAPVKNAATPATGGAKLPGGVRSRIRKIDRSLDAAKTALGRGSVQRAELEYGKAAKAFDEIKTRYAASAPPDHPEMAAVSARMAAVKAEIDGAAGAAASDKAARAKAAGESRALAEQWIARMKPFVTRDDPKYLDTTAWGKESEDFKRIRTNYGEAAALFAEYGKVDFPLGKPMALQNVERKLKSALDDLRGTYAREDTEKASAGWLARLEPYVTSMGPKNLVVSFTSSVSDMEHQKKMYDEASAAFAEYRKADFPLGKSPRLQQVEDELAERLAKFPEVYRRSVGAQAGNAEQKIDEEIAFLESRQEWKTDTTKRPYCLSDERISAARARVDTAAGVLPAGDASLKRMREKMAKLVAMNDERRKVRAERTRMEPDRFSGDGGGAIRKKAEELVTGRIRGAKVLRSAVISEDWKEESVQEWTDTTHTATRFRTTRSVTAQVAARKKDGEVRLYTLHVAKDRRADGSWGPLYGNLHSDIGELMLAKNVGK